MMSKTIFVFLSVEGEANEGGQYIFTPIETGPRINGLYVLVFCIVHTGPLPQPLV